VLCQPSFLFSPIVNDGEVDECVTRSSFLGLFSYDPRVLLVLISLIFFVPSVSLFARAVRECVTFWDWFFRFRFCHFRSPPPGATFSAFSPFHLLETSGGRVPASCGFSFFFLYFAGTRPSPSTPALHLVFRVCNFPLIDSTRRPVKQMSSFRKPPSVQRHSSDLDAMDTPALSPLVKVGEVAPGEDGAGLRGPPDRRGTPPAPLSSVAFCCPD